MQHPITIVYNSAHADEEQELWMVPYPRNPFFTGRDDVLAEIHTRFRKRQARSLSQSQSISGLGGIGKTQIAVEYAYRYAQEYDTILWIQADTEEHLRTGYLAIAQTIQLAEKDEQDYTLIVEAVQKWLKNTPKRYLLILDNATSVEVVSPFLPPKLTGHILLTTQTIEAATQQLKVETMNQDQGALLLLRQSGLIPRDAALELASPSDLLAAKKFSTEVQGLPGALAQAGAFIKQTTCSVQEYCQYYQKRRKTLQKHYRTRENKYPSSITITSLLSFEKVAQLSPLAANLLRLCAFLAPNSLPEELFYKQQVQDRGHTHPKKKEKRGFPRVFSWWRKKHALALSKIHMDEINAKQKENALLLLEAFSLIQRDTSKQTISLHTSIQTAIRDAMPEEVQKKWKQQAILKIAAFFPPLEFEYWKKCEDALSHALICATWIEHEQIVLPEAAQLLNQITMYLSERGCNANTEIWYQQAIWIGEQVIQEHSEDLAVSLNNLAMFYRDQGKYELAEPLYQQALEIRKQEEGLHHLDTAMSMNNLALLYYAQGNYEAAEPFLVQTLRIYEQELGLRHADTTASLNNLAELYRVQGKYPEAEPLYLQILKIYKQEEHPDTAMMLNNLALLYYAQGRYEEGETLLLLALEYYEQEVGATHPSIAMTLNNLAELYLTQGQYEQAEPLYLQALEIYERALGATHPSTAMTLNNLAGLYQTQGKCLEAEMLYLQALEIRKQELGPQHPDTAVSMNNLALLYYTQEKYEEAESLLIQALEIYEQQLGPQHPTTKIERGNYAGLLRAMAREEEAAQLEIGI